MANNAWKLNNPPNTAPLLAARVPFKPPEKTFQPPKQPTKPPENSNKPPENIEKQPEKKELPPEIPAQPPKKTEQPPPEPKKTEKPPEKTTQPTQKSVQPVKRPPKITVQPINKPVTQRPMDYTKPSNQEGFLARMRELSWIWKIASLVFLVGFLFQMIAYATPHWIDVNDASGDVIGYGLWSSCTTLSSCTFRGLESHCLNTLRGFGGVAILLCIMVCPLLVMYVNKPLKRRCLAITAIIITGITAICLQIVTATFTRTFGCSAGGVTSGSGGSWSWSLALSILAVLCLSVATLLFIVQEMRVCTAYRRGQHPRRTIGPGIRVT